MQTWTQPDISNQTAVNEEPFDIHPDRLRANFQNMESNGQIRDVQMSPRSNSPSVVKNPTWIPDDNRGKIPKYSQCFLSTPHTVLVINIIILLDVDNQ